MASSGKKGKKNKGTVISLQSFLANGDTPAGTTQVAKKIRNVSGDDSDDGSNPLVYHLQLPTAPRANRVFDDDSIPHKPPFIAYINNLPFDANEDDIHEFFGSVSVVSVRLPREDGETGRVRGFGYVEFDSRDDLIEVLSLPDPSIKGRRIRIELSNENDQQNGRQKNSRRGFDNFGNNGENRDSTNWRRDNQNQESGSGFERDRDRERYTERRERRPPTEDNNTAGSWRTGTRPAENDYSPRRDRGGDRQRESRNYNRFNRDEDHHHQPQQQQQQEEERPKLQLKPRTLPLPEIVTKNDDDNESVKEGGESANEEVKPPKPSGVSAEKVFGSAKPVDTAARELQIEERLEEARRADKEKRELEKSDLIEQLENVQIEKTDKENANTAISWRRRDDAEQSDEKNGSLDRSDDRRQNNRSRDYNRYNNRNREKNDRTDMNKSKFQPRDVKDRDVKERDVKERDVKERDVKERDVKERGSKDREVKEREDRSKRDNKIERPLPKYQPNQTGPVLQSSNKYSGLDDEASE